MSPPIAVMDSGVGGLPYLEAARRLLPAERFVYLADREGFPYGTKRPEEIVGLVLDRVRRLRASRSPKALVIACNTASQAALAPLRAANPGFPVVGTVPAVKPAAARSRSGTIGVMATARAVEDPYLDELVARHAPGIRVAREAAQDLVAFVERRLFEAAPAERRAILEPHVRRLVAAGADEIVLACTHFLHVAPDIAALAAELAPGVEVLDSREGVARRLAAVLDELGLLEGGERGGARRAAPSIVAAASSARAADLEGLDDCLPQAGGELLLSGPEPFEPVYAAFAARFGLAGPYPLDGPTADAAGAGAAAASPAEPGRR